jgi:hypothetical protein
MGHKTDDAVPPLWRTSRNITLSIYNEAGNWSEREDSNLRPPAPEAGALPGCATLRPWPCDRRLVVRLQEGAMRSRHGLLDQRDL